MGKIDLNPLQVLRKLKPVGPGIQAGPNVDHSINPSIHSLEDKPVDSNGSYRHHPSQYLWIRHSPRYGPPALSAERRGEQILKKCSRPLAFKGAKGRNPKGSIGNIGYRGPSHFLVLC